MKSACAFAIGLLLAFNASAEVVEKSADHFLVAFSAHVEAPPARVYAAIGDVAHWWSAEQTWSGKAENLSLKAEAGSCFCERWAEGSAEHGRVILALKDSVLRLETALGPLQDLALNGILSFQLDPADNDTTALEVAYRVSGSSKSGLEGVAPAIDGVLALQIDRLLRFVDTGNPEEVEAPVEEEPPSKREARAELIEEWAKQAAGEQADNAGAKLKLKPTTKPKVDKPMPPTKD